MISVTYRPKHRKNIKIQARRVGSRGVIITQSRLGYWLTYIQQATKLLTLTYPKRLLVIGVSALSVSILVTYNATLTNDDQLISISLALPQPLIEAAAEARDIDASATHLPSAIKTPPPSPIATIMDQNPIELPSLPRVDPNTSQSAETEPTLNLPLENDRLATIGRADDLNEAKTDISDVIQWKTTHVRPGDNLALLFAEFGLSPQLMYRITHANLSTKKLNRLQVGDDFAFGFRSNGDFDSMRYQPSRGKGFEIQLINDELHTQDLPEHSLRPAPNWIAMPLPISLKLVMRHLFPLPTPHTKLNWQVITVLANENMASIFKRLKLSAGDLHQITQLSGMKKILKNIHPGESFDFSIDARGELLGLRFEESESSRVVIRKEDSNFRKHSYPLALEKRTASVTGIIEGSLFEAGVNSGMSDTLIMKLADIFGWDVDFVLDIRRGDSFTVIYEEIYRDGVKLRDGDIVAASFHNNNRDLQAVRFSPKNGRAEYFTPSGRNMRKEFLRTPVDFTRISGRFTYARKHPVLKNVTRPHRGVDYAAGTGTPVKVTGDGKVIFRGKNRSYGNHIIVQHGSQYKTLYAHLSKFHRNSKRGSRVKQGQLIAYVGSTGLATGPHLHYEFRVNDVHKNPLKIEFPKAASLPAEQMAQFQTETRPIMAQLASIDPQSQFASVE